MIGELAALGSAALWASSAVGVKDVTLRLGAFYIMAVRTAIAAALAFVFVLVVEPSALVPSMSLLTFAILLGSGLIAILGDATFIRAIAVDNVGRVFTISTSLYILMSVSGSIVFLDGRASWFLPLGGLAVLAGSRLVLREPRRALETGEAAWPGEHPPGEYPQGMHSPRLALWLSVLAGFLWTVSLLILSSAMKSVDPLSATVLRLPFMAAAMVLIALIRGDHRRHAWPARDLKNLALSGAMVLGSILLFLVSAKHSGAGTVAVLTSTSPIFAVPLAYVFLHEKVTPRVAGGVATCLAGICLASL